MAEFPALPLFTDAYLADTRHLTTEEHGAYLLLLMCAWRTRGCGLKDDDRHLAKLIGVTLPRWRKLKPVLSDFFTVENGTWRQKKLTNVYETVSEKVEKNRRNGAKGGRIRAERTKALESGTCGQANALATKTKAKFKTKEQEAASIAAVAAAAGLPLETIDGAPLLKWQAAGADIEADILPTIQRLYARESKKGKPPRHLGYYDSAVMEARNKRLNAKADGAEYASTHPEAPAAKPFNAASAADWQLFLGSPKSRFRADYIRRHWLISHDHGLFTGGTLGPNPWNTQNPLIPVTIYESYGPAWGWLPSPQKKD